MVQMFARLPSLRLVGGLDNRGAVVCMRPLRVTAPGVVPQPHRGRRFGVVIACDATTTVDGPPGRPSPCSLKGPGLWQGPDPSVSKTSATTQDRSPGICRHLEPEACQRYRCLAGSPSSHAHARTLAAVALGSRAFGADDDPTASIPTMKATVLGIIRPTTMRS